MMKEVMKNKKPKKSVRTNTQKNRERKKLIKSGVDMRERRAAVFKVDEAEIEEHK